MLIFVLQAIWQFISDFAGKDIELLVIAKFLFYYLPYQVPLLLPLTVLVASIMTFGNFAENYEFAAMKSAGISLQRAMRSLILFIVIFGFATFYFSNTVIPWAEFKAINLKNNIAKVKPAMAIVEGVFTEVGNYNIKVNKKSGENNQFLEDVIIHQKLKGRPGNYTVIKSEEGELASEENSNFLKLILHNGHYYNEIYPNTVEKRRTLPFVKSSFKEHIINIDLSEINKVDLGDESVSHPYKMLNISELVSQIDTASADLNRAQDRYQNLIIQRNGFSSVNNRTPIKKKIKKDTSKKENTPNKNQDNNSSSQNKPEDSAKLSDFAHKAILTKSKSIQSILNENRQKDNNQNNSNKNTNKTDPQYKDLSSVYDMEEIVFEFPDRESGQIFSRAISTVNSILPQIKNQQNSYKNRFIVLNKTETHLHNKYALGVACVVLFFVGAPLGAIIRKGGIGLPLVFAIVIFLIYHFLGIFAQNSAETGKISPFLGSWISTFVFLPVGIYFTYRATTDQGFVNIDFISVPIRKLLIKLKLDKYKTRE
ncbi:hypothetical protein GCM10010831_20620 [Psychroflexus salis]|uniref:Lipopolysaccharide export system permease protein n=2 Tax=Psychroflexus salis TaxID=1526574 RepID=A0A917EB47_9FLAO|nr:hypothetical protein GCM10010831_20620 [Psychroflexus salis]